MNRVIGCSEAVRQLWEFLDRGLGVDDHQAVERHLAFCVRCCGELEFARELRRLLHTEDGGELPADAHARLRRFIDGLGGDQPGGPG